MVLPRFERLPRRRALIDRRALSDAIARLPGSGGALRRDAVALLKPALAAGRAEIARRLEETPSAGEAAASGYAYLTDQLLRLVHDLAAHRLHPLGSPTASERLTLMAVGGYGRGEMAPGSDVDIGFVTPWKSTGWSEAVTESVLYTLWDLGLKVGHSTRSLDELVAVGRADLTVRTALLEARWVWGDQPLYDEAAARIQAEVLSAPPRAFVADKLAERNARHRRMGDSRYVVEPNLKDGKGGLRDLHTLFWIGKYIHRVGDVGELVAKGLMTEPELRQFLRAQNYLWAVRCHLHLLSGRAEERLTFDVQPEIASRLRYRARGRQSPVERFMRHYFLTGFAIKT